jgi:hypothetical protein
VLGIARASATLSGSRVDITARGARRRAPAAPLLPPPLLLLLLLLLLPSPLLSGIDLRKCHLRAVCCCCAARVGGGVGSDSGSGSGGHRGGSGGGRNAVLRGCFNIIHIYTNKYIHGSNV